LQVSHRIGSLETCLIGKTSPAILKLVHASVVRLFVKSLRYASHHFPQLRSNLGIDPSGFDLKTLMTWLNALFAELCCIFAKRFNRPAFSLSLKAPYAMGD
jgi:hypothetical protein